VGCWECSTSAGQDMLFVGCPVPPSHGLVCFNRASSDIPPLCLRRRWMQRRKLPSQARAQARLSCGTWSMEKVAFLRFIALPPLPANIEMIPKLSEVWRRAHQWKRLNFIPMGNFLRLGLRTAKLVCGIFDIAMPCKRIRVIRSPSNVFSSAQMAAG
jgi:hypothetical protein